MKANQFATADEAVSPVIGVILMVAITVVLAAVVFVLVSDLGDQGDAAPNLSFNRNEGLNQLSVVRADSGLNWAQFDMRTSAPTTATLNGDATNTEDIDASGAQLVFEATVVASPAVSAGDSIVFCHDHATDGASNVQITLIHRASNTQVYSTSFADLPVCP